MASGKPVIALRRGGVLESVPERNPRAGFFYDQPLPEFLEAAVKRFELEEASLSPIAIQAAAQKFSETRFQSEMRRIITGQQIKSDIHEPSLAVSSAL
jgi:glycosyltransferase involved in cell wall biosynthesis